MAIVRKTAIPKAPLGRLLKEAGAERVSQDALDALERLLDAYAKKICVKAVSWAKNAGRKTVTGDDIEVGGRQNQS